MADDNGINCFRVNWKFFPVAQPELFQSLKQSAIKQEGKAVIQFNQVLRAGYGFGAAQEFYFNVHAVSIRECGSGIKYQE
jgi:hypothetical protein